MKKLLMRLLIAVATLSVVLYFTRNVIARKAVEVGAEKMTGFPLEVGDMNLALFRGQVEARAIKLKNSPEFGEPLFVDMQQLYVDYYLSSMVGGEPHVKEMLVDIKEIVIVKNKSGETNVMKLKGVLTGTGAPETAKSDGKNAPTTNAANESATKYRVDTLRIKVSKVTHVAYAGDKVSRKEFPADLDVTYKNLTDATQINKLVLLAVMSKVKLPDIGVHTDDLKKGVSNVTNAAGKALNEVGDVLEGAGKGALDAGKSLFDNIKKVVPGGGTKN